MVLAFVASTFTAAVTAVATNQQPAAAAAERAAILFPFSGNTWLSGDGPATHHHFWNAWAMDLHAPVGTAVKAKFASSDGNITLSVASVGATCAPPNSAGSNVTVNVYVDGTHVGEVIYGHLNNVQVSAGQSIGVNTTLGYLNNWTWSSCWMDNTSDGVVHTHIEVEKGCYRNLPAWTSYGDSTPVGLLKSAFASNNDSVCNESEVTDVVSGGGSSGGDPYLGGFARNGGFNNGSTRWSAVNANFVVRNDADAYEGIGYGRTNTSANGYIRNDYTRNIQATESYCAEAMVRADAGGTASGSFVLWLIGDSGNENSIVNFTVGDTWKPVRACTYATGDHTSLSVRVYPASGGPTVSVDAVDVHRSVARNGGFNNGTTRWTPINANYVTRQDSDAYEGAGYARTNTSANGYIRNDFNITISATDMYCAETMVRADSGGTASGSFVLWLIGVDGNENSIVNFTVGDTWTPISVCTYASGDHSSLSTRIYPTSGGSTVSVDAVSTHRSVARNGGFNNGTTRWTPINANFVTRNDADAYEGAGYGRTNTVSGGYIRNDYTMDIDVTDMYCAEAMVRADVGDTASGSFVLWLIGDSGNENSIVNFTVGDTWTPVRVCTYATGDHTSLSVRVYPQSGGPTVSVDAVDVH